mmetsp:Transcript_24946/g.39608  ORF Transcript_24946/g.39608 Transcript_24946/m.39608 type:complete len:290 (+) Transcript_24946:155-1024(+)
MEVDAPNPDQHKVEPYPEERRQTLLKWNIGAACLHFVQSFVQLILALTVDNFKNFKLPLRNYHWTMIETAPDGSGYLQTVSNSLGNVAIGPLICIFFFLSAFFHCLVCLPKFHQMYWSQINAGRNYFRWIEYSISSTVMIWIIAMLFGVNDITLLISISFANATMNFLGLFQERYNNVRDTQWTVDWLPFQLGCFIGACEWVVVFAYVLGSQLEDGSELPGFVWGILIGYVLFFNTFPVNMYLQYKRVSYWQDYIFGEWCYIVLSLASKTLLGWLVFGGLNQPNEFTDS